MVPSFNSSLLLNWTTLRHLCVLNWPRNVVVPKTGRKFPVSERPSNRIMSSIPISNPHTNYSFPTFTHIALPLHAFQQMSLPCYTTLEFNGRKHSIGKLNELKPQNLAGEPRGSGMGAHEDLIFPGRCTR